MSDETFPSRASSLATSLSPLSLYGTYVLCVRRKVCMVTIERVAVVGVQGGPSPDPKKIAMGGGERQRGKRGSRERGSWSLSPSFSLLAHSTLSSPCLSRSFRFVIDRVPPLYLIKFFKRRFLLTGCLRCIR